MRRVLVLAAVVLAPNVAAASPVITDLLERLVEASPSNTPDLSVLTTEPIVRSESSGYGWREDPVSKRRRKFHHGSDYRADRGTPVVVAGNGTVTFAGRQGGYGNVIYVDHGGGVLTRYAHLRKIETKVGAVLVAGTRIGQVGATGRVTGPHLHFEVRLDGRSVDPNTALVIAELARESPTAARLAAYALVPEVQEHARDAEDPQNRRALQTATRPERKGARTRDRALW